MFLYVLPFLCSKFEDLIPLMDLRPRNRKPFTGFTNAEVNSFFLKLISMIVRGAKKKKNDYVFKDLDDHPSSRICCFLKKKN